MFTDTVSGSEKKDKIRLLSTLELTAQVKLLIMVDYILYII